MNPVAGKNAKIARYYAIVVTGNVPARNSPVRMPCGFIVAPPESGWPRRDVPCPCGDERRVVILFRE